MTTEIIRALDAIRKRLDAGVPNLYYLVPELWTDLDVLERALRIALTQLSTDENNWRGRVEKIEEIAELLKGVK